MNLPPAPRPGVLDIQLFQWQFSALPLSHAKAQTSFFFVAEGLGLFCGMREMSRASRGGASLLFTSLYVGESCMGRGASRSGAPPNPSDQTLLLIDQ